MIRIAESGDSQSKAASSKRKPRGLKRRWADFGSVAPAVMLIAYFLYNPVEGTPTLHFYYLMMIWTLALLALNHVGTSRRLITPIRLSIVNLVVMAIYAIYDNIKQYVALDPRSIYLWFSDFHVYARPSLYMLFYLWVMRKGRLEAATKFTFAACMIYITQYIANLLVDMRSDLLGIASNFHNSFLACMAMVSLFYLIDLQTRRRTTGIKTIAIVTVCMCLFTIPFFGVLRAASMILIILTSMMLFMYGIRGKILYVGVIILVVAIGLWFTVGERVGSLFRENRYGYRSPLEVLQGATQITEGTGEQRLTWWTETALPIFEADPAFGSAFNFVFTVNTSGGEVAGVGMFHNYWASMLVDGGLVLAVPHTLLLIYPVFVGFGLVRKKDRRPIPYILWILAVLMTNITNGWGHTTFHGEFEYMIYGTAAANIIYCRITRKSLSQLNAYSKDTTTNASSAPMPAAVTQ